MKRVMTKKRPTNKIDLLVRRSQNFDLLIDLDDSDVSHEIRMIIAASQS